MKKMLAVLLLVVFSTTGCGISFEAPADLIKTPILSEKDMEETELIRSFLGTDEKIEIPRKMNNPSPTVDIDIDGDGKDEKIVFFSKRNGYQTGISLLRLDKNGLWSLYYQDKQAGRAISYFELKDISGDGSLELLLGVNVGGYYNLYIYEFTKNGLEIVDQIKYSQMNLFEKDAHNTHIVTSLNNHTSDELTTEVNVYEWQRGHMNAIFNRVYEGFSQELEVGNVGYDKKGVYLGLSLDLDTIEYILLLSDDDTYQEKAHLKSEYSLSFSEKPQGFIGVSRPNDVMSILSVLPPLDITKRQVRDYLQIWKIWNGKSSFIDHHAILENSLDGYQLKIPIAWLSHLSYQFVFENGVSQINFYDKSKSGITQPVFIIQTIENYLPDGKVKIDGVALGTSVSNHRLYVAKFYQNNFSGQVINEEILKKYFSVEGGQ